MPSISYEKAIRSAHANGFVHNAALANELAATILRRRVVSKRSQNAYLLDARYGYLRWGANGKVKQTGPFVSTPRGRRRPLAGPQSTTCGAGRTSRCIQNLKNEPDPALPSTNCGAGRTPGSGDGD